MSSLTLEVDERLRAPYNTALSLKDNTVHPEEAGPSVEIQCACSLGRPGLVWSEVMGSYNPPSDLALIERYEYAT